LLIFITGRKNGMKTKKAYHKIMMGKPKIHITLSRIVWLKGKLILINKNGRKEISCKN